MKIEAGKFYKTRDGRKVGPMRSASEGFKHIGSFIGAADGEDDALYRQDGTCPFIPDDDLISEWPTLTPHQQRTAEMIKVMQAYVDGDEIEWDSGKEYLAAKTPNWSWGLYAYRIAPNTSPDTIDWSHVAPEFKWMARDSNGKCYLFTGEPRMGETVWYYYEDEIKAENFSSYRPGNCDWKDSLVKRPE